MFTTRKEIPGQTTISKIVEWKNRVWHPNPNAYPIGVDIVLNLTLLATV